LKAEKVRLLAFTLHACSLDGTLGKGGQVWPHHPIQGGSLDPIVQREVCLKLPEVLGHLVLSTIFPLWNVWEVRYHFDGDLPLLLMLLWARMGSKCWGLSSLDSEETGGPWDEAPVVACPCGTSHAVLLRGDKTIACLVPSRL
jgi:hypothetical protein